MKREIKPEIRARLPQIGQGSKFTAISQTDLIPRDDGRQQGLVEITVARRLDPSELADFHHANYLARQAHSPDSPMGREALGLINKLGNAVTVHAASGTGQRGSLAIRVEDTPGGHRVTSAAVAMNTRGDNKLSFKAGVTSNPRVVEGMEDGMIASIAHALASTTYNPRPPLLFRLAAKVFGKTPLPLSSHTDLELKRSERIRLRQEQNQHGVNTRDRALRMQAGRQLETNPVPMTPAFQKQVFDFVQAEGAYYDHQLELVQDHALTVPTARGSFTYLDTHAVTRAQMDLDSNPEAYHPVQAAQIHEDFNAMLSHRAPVEVTGPQPDIVHTERSIGTQVADWAISKVLGK